MLIVTMHQILSEKILPTKVLCTPALLPRITKLLSRFLGPKGLMPAIRRGTVTDDIAKAVRTIAGTVDWKSDKEGIIRIAIGRVRRFEPLATSRN
jgi:large subunit ribosomal protein L1